MHLKQCQTLAQYRREVLRRPQAWIAKRVGCPQGQISKIERGHMPRTWELERYADAYEISIPQLQRLIEGSRQGGFDLPLLQATASGSKAPVLPMTSEPGTQEVVARALAGDAGAARIAATLLAQLLSAPRQQQCG